MVNGVVMYGCFETLSRSPKAQAMTCACGVEMTVV